MGVNPSGSGQPFSPFHPHARTSRPRPPGFPPGARYHRFAGGGRPFLAAPGPGELRRPRRPDRHAPPGTGGSAALDLGSPLPARPQLLPAAAGSGGDPAGHLPGLAAARHPGGSDRRGALPAPLGAATAAAEFALRTMGPSAPVRGHLLGPQTGCAGDRDPGLLAAGTPHPQGPPAGCDRRRRPAGIAGTRPAPAPADRPGGAQRLDR
jgi:hypothetical protein